MKRVFEGRIERNALDFLGITIEGKSYDPGLLRLHIIDHIGKRVRITVEVLDDPHHTAASPYLCVHCRRRVPENVPCPYCDPTATKTPEGSGER